MLDIVSYMTRPKCCRKIASLPGVRQYAPVNSNEIFDGIVSLTLDELEAVRLADYENLYQEDAADRMGVSRQTFGRIIISAHRKISDAILNGRVLEIGGGTVSLGKTTDGICRRCNRHFETACDKHGKLSCPRSNEIEKE
jgi:uncharacterized protein